MTEWQAGIGAFREGRLREAVDRLRRAAGDREGKVSQAVRYQTLAYLGAGLYSFGLAAEAVDAFEAAVRLNPSPAPPIDLLVNLANAYLATGKRSRAQQALEDVLRMAPGQMDVQMLLARLINRPEGDDIVGGILGESPAIVKRFLATVTFGTVSQGYSPDQVQAAISQIQYYIDYLSAQLAQREQELGMHAVEIDRLRQSEEALIEALLEARQEKDTKLANRPSHPFSAEASPPNDEEIDELLLTPLQKLFQQKP